MHFAPDKAWTAIHIVIDNFYYNQSLLISGSNSALYDGRKNNTKDYGWPRENCRERANNRIGN